MRIIKDSEHSLLLNYFGLNNRYYLAVTVLTFFSFDSPAAVLPEQDMWPFVQKELGKDAILDMAMPKPKGEYLVWGRCFTPDGTARGASQVTVRVGNAEKMLYIFGDRIWKSAPMSEMIGQPAPFTEMPVTYSRAFGGTGFDRNPVGKGVSPLISPSGSEVHPLPNIEDPRRLMGSPSDRPDPAGLAPIDYTWPQRARKLGTYDNRWFQERWPFYPDDMDWTYFNAAPEDQQIEGFFNGTESFAIAGMHPKKHVLESRLPEIRHRLFVNQVEDMKKPDGETVFKEIITHFDTVWLFPHAERGVLVARGIIEVKDDEALDIPHLYIANEALTEGPRSIEVYYEQFLKLIDRSITIDIAPQMEEAKKEFTKLADMLKDLPLRISDSIAQGLGQAPRSAKAPAEVAIESIARLDGSKTALVESEKELLAMKARYGHLMKIDTGSFAAAAQRFDQAKQKLKTIPGIVDILKKEKAGTIDRMKDKFREAFKGKDLTKIKDEGVDFDAILDAYQDEPGDPWRLSGMRFVEACRDRLQEDPELLGAIRGMGIRPYTVKRSWVGINPRELRFDRKDWGLKELQKDGVPEPLVIPAGLVIPRFKGVDLETITIRPIFEKGVMLSGKQLVTGLADGGRDTIVAGSSGTAMALSVTQGKPFVCVADDLEALFLRQELGDFCAIIAMKPPFAELDKDTGKELKDAPQFLVTVYPDKLDKPRDLEMEPWEKLSAGAEPLNLPKGPNLFEAKNAGADLWQWVADALHPGTAPPAESKPKDVDVMKPGAIAELIPVIDVEEIYKKVKDQLTARMKPGLDMLAAKKSEGLETFRKEFAKQGLDLDAVLKDFKSPVAGEANPYSGAKKEYAKQLSRLRQDLVKQGRMTSEINQQLGDAEKKAQMTLSNAEKLFDEGQASLAASTARLNAGKPDWAKKLLAKAGLDPDDPAPLKPLTRGDVIDRHGRGLSLASRNMAGIDLSNLDLSGGDFRRANLQKANLKGAKLDGADMTGAISGEADLSGASMIGANLSKGIFQKAKFPGADISGANLMQAMMSETDFTGANMTGAILVKTLLENAVLRNARMVDVSASEVYLLSADLTGADLSGADLTKSIFLKTTLHGANLSKSKIREAAFLEANGENVNFSGADMYNSRILNGSKMPGGNFTDTKADRVSWMKSDLSGSDFRGSTIERGLLQECDLSGCNFSRVKAKQARLTKSNLSDSDLTEINLFQGSLRKSKLVRTDLRRANLYGVEFYRTGVGETKLDGADLKMTKLDKRMDLLPVPPRNKKDDTGGKQ